MHDDVLHALQTVMDPELRRNIVELDMVRDIVDDDQRVGATIVLTTAGCPLRSKLQHDAEAALAAIAGARVVEVKLAAMTEAERETLARRLQEQGQFVPTAFGPGSTTQVVAVASGKGGVGKSTITANVAVALAANGYAVGLVDADAYGPTIPLMLGLPAIAPAQREGQLVPPEAHGVKVISMGFFLPNNEPVVWRGPLLARAIEQFLGDVLWGSLDFLLIDLPPGTGDVALTISQTLPDAAMLIVTTPQDAAAQTAVKAAKMAQMTGHRVLGVVENMAYYVCSNCGAQHSILGTGGGQEIAQAIHARLLGQLPLDEGTRQAGDVGIPVALDTESDAGAAFRALAAAIASALTQSDAADH